MKPFKCKNVIAPDKGWFICEYSCVKPNNGKNNKKFYVRKFNRELRQFFRKILRRYKDVAED